MKTIFVSFLSVALLAGAQAGESPVAASINQFGLDLHHRLAGGAGNLVVSPWSIESALAMTWAGAAGKTKSEMGAVLHLGGEDAAVHAGFQAIADDLQKLVADSEAGVKRAAKNGGPGTPLEIRMANRLFGHTGYAFEKPFLDLTASRYGARFQPMDFVKAPEESRKSINAWVEQRTKDRIRELIPAGVIDRETRLVLTNAIHLKASWAHAFDDEPAAPFFVNGKKRQALPGLRRQGQFGYGQIPGGVLVTVPYAGEGLQFVLFVPEARNGLATMEQGLTPEHLDRAAKAPLRTIFLHFPKFKLEPDRVMLGQHLIGMGMPSAFNLPWGSADFSGMAPRKPDDFLFIGAVIHKAFIAVDQHGTEAAASTAVVLPRVTSALPGKQPEPLEIRVDRPFAFAIQHKASGTCLFLGRVSDPR